MDKNPTQQLDALDEWPPDGHDFLLDELIFDRTISSVAGPTRCQIGPKMAAYPCAAERIVEYLAAFHLMYAVALTGSDRSGECGQGWKTPGGHRFAAPIGRAHRKLTLNDRDLNHG